MSHLVREFCAENMTLVPQAVEAGARRIELCDNLAAGGTTPSYGVIGAAVAFARPLGVSVMVMCRPRGGDFIYDASEQAMLADDVACARGLGATGVVFGCVRHDEAGELAIDADLVSKLVRVAKGEGKGLAAGAPPVQVTFHMAFDALGEGRQREAIDVLADLGVERILTHGGPLGTPIEDNLERIARLSAHAAGRLNLMPGGGVSWRNAEEVAARLGAGEVHGTGIVRL